MVDEPAETTNDATVFTGDCRTSIVSTARTSVRHACRSTTHRR